MCGTAEFVCGKVTLVTPAFVDVGYQRIRYDFLVIASGSKAPSNLRPKALTLAGRAASVDLEAQHVMSSAVSTVVVVGGGFTAVEYAAALKTNAPSKTVGLLLGCGRVAAWRTSTVCVCVVAVGVVSPHLCPVVC
jgi:NADH dehydrogenase FAD-containing subunit